MVAHLGLINTVPLYGEDIFSVHLDLSNVLGGVFWPLQDSVGAGTALSYNTFLASGRQLLNNENFGSWSGGNPVYWSVSESPPNSEVLESSGACRMTSDDTFVQIQEDRLTIGEDFRATLEVTSITGNIAMGDGSENPGTYQNINAAGTATFDWTAEHATFRISRNSACDAIFDNASLVRRNITKNATAFNALNTDITAGEATGIPLGKSYLFGVGSFVNAYSSSFNSFISPSYTVNLFFRPSAGFWTDNTLRYFFLFYSSDNNLFRMRKEEDNTLTATQIGQGITTTASAAITPSDFCMLSMVVNADLDTLSLYQNGVLLDSASGVVDMIGQLNSTYCRWGNGGISTPVLGNLSYVSYFRGAATPTQLQKIAQVAGVT